MDTDKDGNVDRGEFLAKMLVKLNKCQQVRYTPGTPCRCCCSLLILSYSLAAQCSQKPAWKPPPSSAPRRTLQEDVTEILQQFDFLDEDNSGLLNSVDIKMRVAAEKAAAP